jgi:sugar O-acyltransferase (sialic acid O-acetyltransferase NeuD family)
MSDEKIPVVMLGAGGYAAVIHEILNTRSDVLLIGCTDKALGISERSIDEGVTLRILGDDDILPQLADQYPGLNAVFALGPDLMDVRARLIRRLDLEKVPALTAIHKSAVVSPRAKIDDGTVVRGGAVVSTASQIGRCCLVNLGAGIDHDAHLGTNVYVGQGAQISSHVQVGDNVVIEMGASINSRVTIGIGARVTGGAFVNTDVPDYAVVVGVPARVVRYLNPL